MKRRWSFDDSILDAMYKWALNIVIKWNVLRLIYEVTWHNCLVGLRRSFPPMSNLITIPKWKEQNADFTSRYCPKSDSYLYASTCLAILLFNMRPLLRFKWPWFANVETVHINTYSAHELKRFSISHSVTKWKVKQKEGIMKKKLRKNCLQFSKVNWIVNK